MLLYLALNLASLSVPLVVSFHPRIKLYKYWKALFIAIVLSMIPFIIWDVIFANIGIWKFKESYLSGVYFINLPIEEWLFFVCIPYACIFTHVALLELKPIQLPQKWVQFITLLLLMLFLIGAVVWKDKTYTFWNFIFGFIILLVVFLKNKVLLSSYYYTFLFMLIPFLIVNGILTGSGIVDEVVWYNNAENLGIRVLTIPIEDFLYAFSLVLLNLFLFQKFKAVEF
jgi:lycopene cyclase domain-containing protein